MTELVLASQSPRRSELLKQIGVDFEVLVSQVDEEVNQVLSPNQLVEYLALKKAESVAKLCQDRLVLGADTIVVYNDQVLGKPKDKQEAVNMLKMLSGNCHHVITGIALVHSLTGEKLVEHEITKVYFTALSEETIKAYVASNEPFDKAGAYGIQGLASLFVEKIEGCYFNVVGLPVFKVGQALRKFGIRVL